MGAVRRYGGTAGRESGPPAVVPSVSLAPTAVPPYRPTAVSACANKAALPNRSAGTGASAFRIAWSTLSGTVGRTDRTLGTGSVSRFTSIAWVVAPV